MQIFYGDRIGKEAKLVVVCATAIFDPTGEKLLLTRRADNGEWCMPGGHMEPGESAIEASARETEEETGLKVKVGRLIGLYATPHRIATYPDGNRIQSVVLSFEATPVGGELSLSDETTEVGFYSLEDVKTMGIPEHQTERIIDAFNRSESTVIR